MHIFKKLKIRTVCFIFGVGLILFLTIHYAIGQRIAREEKIRSLMDQASSFFELKSYTKAHEILRQAESLLPTEKPDEPLVENLKKITHEVHFNLALSLLKIGHIKQADDLLEQLVHHSNAIIPAEKRHEAYAMTRYYLAWQLRLDGAERAEWAPIANEAREHLRVLSESPSATEIDAKNLEKATRLITLKLTALKELPLPEEIQAAQQANNQNSSGKKQKAKGEGGKRQKRPYEGDIRDKDKIDPQGSAGAPDLRGS